MDLFEYFCVRHGVISILTRHEVMTMTVQPPLECPKCHAELRLEVVHAA
jgi:hypothetical protein